MRGRLVFTHQISHMTDYVTPPLLEQRELCTPIFIKQKTYWKHKKTCFLRKNKNIKTFFHLHINTYIYLHTYIPTYMQTYYIHTYIHTCMHTYIHTYMHTNIQTDIHTLWYVRTYVHTYIYIHIYMHVHHVYDIINNICA